MKLEIALSVIEQYVKDKYQIKVELKSIEDKKMQVTYIDTVELTVKGVKDDKIFFYYEVNGLVDLIATVAKIFLKKKLKNFPVTWVAKTKEITVDLKKIRNFSNLIKMVSITEVHFLKDNILLVLIPLQ
jgi:hypothetical protein